MSYIYVNLDEKFLPKPGRKAPNITQDELFIKMKEAAKKIDSYWDAEWKTKEDVCGIAFIDSDTSVEKDIKVYFSASNSSPYEASGNLIGFHTLDNGFTFFGDFTCCDDIFYSVFYIIYWDGKKLRGYVPTCGNTYNTHTKTGFGGECNYGDVDEERLCQIYNIEEGVDVDFTQLYFAHQGIEFDGDYDKLSPHWPLIEKDIKLRIKVID